MLFSKSFYSKLRIEIFIDSCSTYLQSTSCTANHSLLSAALKAGGLRSNIDIQIDKLSIVLFRAVNEISRKLHNIQVLKKPSPNIVIILTAPDRPLRHGELLLGARVALRGHAGAGGRHQQGVEL